MTELTLYQRRCSCRAYTSRPVPKKVIERLLDAAIWAPSAGGLQPWRFIVVRNQQMRLRLAAAACGQAFVATAPVVIVACALGLVSGQRYGNRGRDMYSLQDTAAAVQNLLLAATEEGLGSCWVGTFDELMVTRVLDVHPSWRPVTLVTLGEAAESPGLRSRDSLDTVARWLD